MKVAALQMVSGTALPANLEAARALLEDAARQGAELVLLPEYFCLLGHKDTDKLAIQEPYGDGPIQRFLADTARSLSLWIVGGTLPLSVPAQELTAGAESGRRVYNSSLVFSPQGQCVARYDKIHLFRYDNGRERYDESAVLKRGNTPVLFELPSRDGHRWRVGMSVCYDLRFAELYRGYAAQGADLLLVPSAFTHTTGQAHWEVLLRARAIENLAFVAAAAQGGRHENGRSTWGQTLLADPWGEVLAQLPSGAGVVLHELDAERLLARRAQLPALTHRLL
jgi:nitrilase